MKKLFIVTLAALGMLACTTVNEPAASEGLLPGKFSVSSTCQVQFSLGNLLYATNGDTSVWFIAPNQYDTVGMYNASISFTDSILIDLFGWGTGNNPTKDTISDLVYNTFSEWGKNSILNGGEYTNAWRTLTKDEWVYLFYGRKNAANLFGFCSIDSINGIIILPDNWGAYGVQKILNVKTAYTQELPSEGDYYYDKKNNHFLDNAYTIEQWSLLEDKGAVFLPAAGIRSSDISCVNSGGYYWSSTPKDDFSAYALIFTSESLAPQSKASRNLGLSVRLVR